MEQSSIHSQLRASVQVFVSDRGRVSGCQVGSRKHQEVGEPERWINDKKKEEEGAVWRENGLML